MKKRKVFLLATVGLLSVGVLTACSSSSKTSGKTYNYVYGGDPATLEDVYKRQLLTYMLLLLILLGFTYL